MWRGCQKEGASETLSIKQHDSNMSDKERDDDPHAQVGF